jgi:lysozyme family protein
LSTSAIPSAAFDAALPFVLRWEGGYVDHPDDPGGATNRGVTQGVYDDWRAQQQQPTRSVREITGDEVRAIYETGYWTPPRCDLLRSQLDLVHFDTAVNMGVGRAIRFLQASLGCAVDGQFGPHTESAAAGCELASTITAYCDAREDYYRRLVEKRPSLGVFLRGWLNRLHALRGEAGLAGLEAAAVVDFGDAGYVARIPDLGLDPSYDF